MLNYKTVESGVLPCEIDISSSKDGVYIRRNIKKIETESETGVLTKYQYEEAFVSHSEYETVSKDLLVKQIFSEDNTPEFDEYKKKLDTPVLYKNGKTYKPKWADLYNKKLNEIIPVMNAYGQLGGDISKFKNLKVNIYDVEATSENAEMMSVLDIIELWFFLLTKQEEYFNEYKQSLKN